MLPLALADPGALQRAGEVLLASCADGAAQVGCCAAACVCLCSAAASPAAATAVSPSVLAEPCCGGQEPGPAPTCALVIPPVARLLVQASAQAAFGALMAQVGAAASLDRPSRRAFAKALSKFVVDARGAVNVR